MRHSLAASQSETFPCENLDMRQLLPTFGWEKQQDVASQILFFLNSNVCVKGYLKIAEPLNLIHTEYPRYV